MGLPFDPISKVLGVGSDLVSDSDPTNITQNPFVKQGSVFNISPVGLNLGELIDAKSSSPPNLGGTDYWGGWLAPESSFQTPNISFDQKGSGMSRGMVVLIGAGIIGLVVLVKVIK